MKLTVSVAFLSRLEVEAIDQANSEAIPPQKTGKTEETEWFDPEVVSREVGDPGVDQQDMGGKMFHVKHLIGIPKANEDPRSLTNSTDASPGKEMFHVKHLLSRRDCVVVGIMDDARRNGCSGSSALEGGSSR